MQHGPVCDQFLSTDHERTPLILKTDCLAHIMIAVGTALSGRPPHRSVRAELLHTALTVDVDVRIGLQDMDGEYVDWEANDYRFL